MDFGLTIMGREAAERAIRGPHPFTHLISISDTTREHPLEGYYNVPTRIALFFDDVSRWRAGYRMPEPEHVERIIQFAQNMRSVPRVELLVHCAQGVSRSTAAAFIVGAVLLGPGQEMNAFLKVLQAQPSADPNDRMVELADIMLARDGAMRRELTALRESKRKARSVP